MDITYIFWKKICLIKIESVNIFPNLKFHKVNRCIFLCPIIYFLIFNFVKKTFEHMKIDIQIKKSTPFKCHTNTYITYNTHAIFLYLIWPYNSSIYLIFVNDIFLLWSHYDYWHIFALTGLSSDMLLNFITKTPHLCALCYSIQL